MRVFEQGCESARFPVSAREGKRLPAVAVRALVSPSAPQRSETTRNTHSKADIWWLCASLAYRPPNDRGWETRSTYVQRRTRLQCNELRAGKNEYLGKVARRLTRINLNRVPSHQLAEHICIACFSQIEKAAVDVDQKSPNMISDIPHLNNRLRRQMHTMLVCPT